MLVFSGAVVLGGWGGGSRPMLGRSCRGGAHGWNTDVRPALGVVVLVQLLGSPLVGVRGSLAPVGWVGGNGLRGGVVGLGTLLGPEGPVLGCWVCVRAFFGGLAGMSGAGWAGCSGLSVSAPWWGVGAAVPPVS